jgi:hypothetical protein
MRTILIAVCAIAMLSLGACGQSQAKSQTARA